VSRRGCATCQLDKKFNFNYFSFKKKCHVASHDCATWQVMIVSHVKLSLVVSNLVPLFTILI